MDEEKHYNRIDLLIMLFSSNNFSYSSFIGIIMFVKSYIKNLLNHQYENTTTNNTQISKNKF